MNFKTSVIWAGKIYKVLEKLHLEDNIALDTFIDNNYPEFISKLQKADSDTHQATPFFFPYSI